MDAVEKSDDLAFCELLRRSDGGPDGEARAVRQLEEIAGYDVAANVRVMALLHDLGGERAVKQALSLLSGLSEAARLLREVPAALALEGAAGREAAARRLVVAARRFREQQRRRLADAVELFHGVDTPAVRELLWDLARNGPNRVAANALVGLYGFSDTRVFAVVRNMATDPDRRRRASALWAIGKMGDPHFSDALLKLMNDGEPALRREALNLMRRMKERRARLTGEPALAARILRVAASGGDREAWISVRGPDGKPADAPPTAFLLRENGALVESYTVERVRPAGPVNVGLVFVSRGGRNEPELVAAEQGIVRVLERKRAEDRFAVLKCRTGSSGPPIASLEAPLSDKAWMVRRAAVQPLLVGDAPQEAGAAALRRMMSGLRSRPGPRHILCCFPTAEDAPSELEALIDEAAESGVRAHVIVAGTGEPPAACIRLAQGTAGAIARGASSSDARDCWEMLYSALIAGYRLRWTGEGEPGRLSLLVSAAAGTGSTEWADMFAPPASLGVAARSVR